jgi:hypothetical protein
MKKYSYFTILFILLILLGCTKEVIKECKLPLLEVSSNVSKPQTDFDLSLTNADDVTLVIYAVKDDKGNVVKEQTSSSKPNFLTTLSVANSGNYSFSAKATTTCDVKDVAPKTLKSQACNAPTKITLKENPALSIVASWTDGTANDIQGTVTWTISPADGSKISDNKGATFSGLKAGVAYTITAKLKDKCNVDKTISEQLATINEYAGYDFYVAENGCLGLNQFTKNFQKVNGLNGYDLLNVIGNNLYTFGSEKYRNIANPLHDSYGGVVYKNGVVLYNDIGGSASYVYGVQESAGNVYSLTGFNSTEGVSAEAYTSFRCIPKVWKNGVLLDSLIGPYSNYVIINNKKIVNKSFGVYVKDLIVRGSDIYVSGRCRDINASNISKTSFGYWKNSVYTQIKIGDSEPYQDVKMLIADNGDIYFYIFNFRSKASLFKNGTEILNGKFDDVNIKDFGVLNGNLYILGVYYKNLDEGYQLGVYKNGVLEFSERTNDATPAKMYIEDGKIFVCTGLSSDYKTSVYEYKPNTKTLFLINSTSMSSICPRNVIISGFQVKKK